MNSSRSRHALFTVFGFFLILGSTLGVLAQAPSQPASKDRPAIIPAAAWQRPLGLPLDNPGRGLRTHEGTAQVIDDGYWQGAPVGGFGAGTFSRTYRGDFARWHVKTGAHVYKPIYANQFAVYQRPQNGPAVAQALMNGRPKGGELKSWQWDYPVGAGDYYALYPKSWFDYRWEKFPARVTLEQFSPVLPGNYKESSYPVAVYNWHAENPTQQPVTVSVLFSWTNMVQWFAGTTPELEVRNTGNVNRFQTTAIQLNGAPAQMKGIVFDRTLAASISEEGDGQFAIAAAEVPGVEITYLTGFPAKGDGKAVWTPFAETGRLPNGAEQAAAERKPLAGAIAVTFTLAPGEKKIVPMVVAWDLPVVQFGAGRKWLRRYTDFFGVEGASAWAIARTALENGGQWSAEIDRWQAPYVNNETRPLWYRGMLFNEIYILADGGSLWGRPMGVPDAPLEFSFLESFDYPFYGSLDVHFYGSMPLIKFWPDLEKTEMQAFVDAVDAEHKDLQDWGWKSTEEGKPVKQQRKVRGALPHDLGAPANDPFAFINQYTYQDPNLWKDLNSKFVLMLWRDYVLSGANDDAFLRRSWPAAKHAMEYLAKFDRNDDGIPENEGFPDQTYDDWTMKGESAYCGGLWLAALRAAEEIAKKMNDVPAAEQYRASFERARKSYIEKLWTGSYFRYDTSSQYRNNVMADQLAGQWYANLTGLGDLVPPEMRRTALKTVFDATVTKFANGEMGAVNGATPDGKPVAGNRQVSEVWSGTTFAVGSLMLSEGLKEEAFKTVWGAYNAIYQRYGFWFRTPEAWEKDGTFRPSMYMRPASIWAMEMIPKGKEDLVQSPAK